MDCKNQVGLADQPAVALDLAQRGGCGVCDRCALRHAAPHPGHDRLDLVARHAAVIREVVVGGARVPGRHRLVAHHLGHRLSLLLRVFIGQEREGGLGLRLVAGDAVLPQQRHDVLVVSHAGFHRRRRLGDQAAIDRRLGHQHRFARQHRLECVFEIVVRDVVGFAREVVLIVDVSAINQRVIAAQHDHFRRPAHAQCGCRFAVDVLHRGEGQVEADGVGRHLADRIARIDVERHELHALAAILLVEPLELGQVLLHERTGRAGADDHVGFLARQVGQRPRQVANVLEGQLADILPDADRRLRGRGERDRRTQKQHRSESQPTHEALVHCRFLVSRRRMRRDSVEGPGLDSTPTEEPAGF